VLKFDAQAAGQLKALGFKIEGDERPMALIGGDVIVSVVTLSDQPDLFALTITVPKGVTFTAFMRAQGPARCIPAWRNLRAATTLMGNLAASPIRRVRAKAEVEVRREQWVYEYLDGFSQEIGQDRTPIDVFPAMVRVMVEWCDGIRGLGCDKENAQALAHAVSELTRALERCLAGLRDPG
jgi:hypothetical protein